MKLVRLTICMCVLFVLGGQVFAQSYHAFFFDQKSDAVKAVEKDISQAKEFIRRIQADLTASPADNYLISALSNSRGQYLQGSALPTGSSLDAQINSIPTPASGNANQAATRNRVETALRSQFFLNKVDSIVLQAASKDDLARAYTQAGLALPEELEKESKDEVGLKVSPEVDITEKSDNFLTGLEPGVFMGTNGEKLWMNKNKKLSYGLGGRFGAMVGSAFAPKDSTEYLEALLSPGSFNALAAGDFRLAFENFAKLSLPNVTIGLRRRPGLSDSSKVHDMLTIAVGGAAQIKNTLMVYAQWIWTKHDITSESGDDFQAVFGGTDSLDNKNHVLPESIQGLFGVQFSLGKQAGKGMYVYIEWRGLRKKDQFEGFGDNKFLTIGFRNEIAL